MVIFGQPDIWINKITRASVAFGAVVARIKKVTVTLLEVLQDYTWKYLGEDLVQEIEPGLQHVKHAP